METDRITPGEGHWLLLLIPPVRCLPPECLFMSEATLAPPTEHAIPDTVIPVNILWIPDVRKTDEEGGRAGRSRMGANEHSRHEGRAEHCRTKQLGHAVRPQGPRPVLQGMLVDGSREPGERAGVERLPNVVLPHP